MSHHRILPGLSKQQELQRRKSMQNKDHIETSIMVLDSARADLSVLSTENEDIFIEELAEIDSQIEKMWIKLAHREHQLEGDKCTICDYAGHDKMTEEIA
jgi:hypothetical protein